MIQGANESDIQNIARNAGIDEKAINNVYNTFKNNPSANAIAKATGINLDALHDDALNLIGNKRFTGVSAPVKTKDVKKFPKL